MRSLVRRHKDLRAVKPLESVNQHRSVRFIQDIFAHLHNAVRADSDQIRVERGMVKSAQRQSVRYGRDAERVSIRQDVSSFEKLIPAQAADRAVVLIRPDDAFPELSLMQALSEKTCHISRRISVSCVSGGGDPRFANRRSSTLTVNVSCSGSSLTTYTGHSAIYRPGTTP